MTGSEPKQARVEQFVDSDTVDRLSRVKKKLDISTTEAMRQIVGVAWLVRNLEDDHGQLYVSDGKDDVPVSLNLTKSSTDEKDFLFGVNLNAQGENRLKELIERYKERLSKEDVVASVIDIGSTVLLAYEIGNFISYVDKQTGERQIFKFTTS